MSQKWSLADSLFVKNGTANVAVHGDDLNALLAFAAAWHIQLASEPAVGSGVVMNVTFPSDVDENKARTVLHRFDELQSPKRPPQARPDSD